MTISFFTCLTFSITWEFYIAKCYKLFGLLGQQPCIKNHSFLPEICTHILTFYIKLPQLFFNNVLSNYQLHRETAREPIHV